MEDVFGGNDGKLASIELVRGVKKLFLGRFEAFFEWFWVDEDFAKFLKPVKLVKYVRSNFVVVF